MICEESRSKGYNFLFVTSCNHNGAWINITNSHHSNQYYTNYDMKGHNIKVCKEKKNNPKTYVVLVTRVVAQLVKLT